MFYLNFALIWNFYKCISQVGTIKYLASFNINYFGTVLSKNFTLFVPDVTPWLVTSVITYFGVNI